MDVVFKYLIPAALLAVAILAAALWWRQQAG